MKTRPKRIAAASRATAAGMTTAETSTTAAGIATAETETSTAVGLPGGGAAAVTTSGTKATEHLGYSGFQED